jgi:hypothetical protein
LARITIYQKIKRKRKNQQQQLQLPTTPNQSFFPFSSLFLFFLVFFFLDELIVEQSFLLGDPLLFLARTTDPLPFPHPHSHESRSEEVRERVVIVGTTNEDGRQGRRCR